MNIPSVRQDPKGSSKQLLAVPQNKVIVDYSQVAEDCEL